MLQTKPDGRNHPGVRRAGCPHPAGPRGGTNVSILNRQCAAGVNARPTEPGKCGGQPGNRGPALQQTPVGDDACIVPHTSRHRKHPGRDKSRPYKPSEHDRPNRTGATTQATVGRDALIPPHPAAAQTPRANMESAPTKRQRLRADTGPAPARASGASVGRGRGSRGQKCD